MEKKKIIVIVAAALVACVVLGVVVNAAIMSTPKNTIENSVDDTIKAVTKSDSADFLTKVLNGGSIEVSANVGKLMKSFGTDDSVDMDVSAKLYFDIAAIKTAFQLVASMDGNALIDALVYLSSEEFAVSSDALLGDDTYGVVFKNIEKNFDSSEFGEDGEYSLGIDFETISAVLDAFENMSDPPKELEKLIDKTSDIADDIYTMLIKSVLKHAEVDKTSGTISCAGKDIKTKDLSIVLNGEAVSLILADAYDYFANDKSLNKYLTEDLVELAPALVDYFYGMALVGVATATPYLPVPDLDDFSSSYYDDDENDDVDFDENIEELKESIVEAIEEAVEEFYDELEDVDIDDQVEECADALEDFEASVVIHINKKNGQIIGLDVEAEYDDADIIDLSVVCGPDWDEITEISVKAEVGGIKMSVSYVVSENTKKAYSADIKVKSDSEVIARASISWDKKEGDLKIKASSTAFFGVDSELVFKGNLITSSKQIVFVLEKFTYGVNTVDLADITITVKANDKMPSTGKVKDILTLSSDDFEEIKEAVQEAITSIGEDLEDVLGGLISGGIDGDDIFGDLDVDYVAPDETMPDESWDETMPDESWDETMPDEDWDW